MIHQWKKSLLEGEEPLTGKRRVVRSLLEDEKPMTGIRLA
jgi:hypothetical protein